MTKTLCAGMAAALVALLVTAAVHAEPISYTWTGMGVTVPGSSKCATYRMTVDVVVDGKSVKGTLKQQGREERQFETTRDAQGLFKARVMLANDNAMNVSGTITDTEKRVLLDGYCKFEGRLTPK
jgi:hypothetical protein